MEHLFNCGTLCSILKAAALYSVSFFKLVNVSHKTYDRYNMLLLVQLLFFNKGVLNIPGLSDDLQATSHTLWGADTSYTSLLYEWRNRTESTSSL